MKRKTYDPQPFKNLEVTQDQYLDRVHTALMHKETELMLLAKWFESPEFIKGVTTTPKQEADETQLAHMWRRYDEGLTYLRGFHYNPHRAYFDRDSYGTGVLRFENGVSLIGSQASQNRWTLPRQASGVTPQVSRSARLDAFLAMLEQRQAMAQWAGLAPICIFIGSKLPLQDLQDPNRRLPPRPVDMQIAAARYVRFCMITQVPAAQETTLAAVWCISLIERKIRTKTRYVMVPTTGIQHPVIDRDTQVEIHTVCPLDAEQTAISQDLIKAAVWKRWLELTTMSEAAAYPVFTAVGLSSFYGQEMTTHSLIPCPEGDSQMIHRMGLLLESPVLEGYRPWDVILGPPRFANLDTLFEIGSPRLTRAKWMNYTLMGRIYPYALLGKDYMIETYNRTAYSIEVPLTKKEVQTFTKSIVPVPPTKWALTLAEEAKESARKKLITKEKAKLRKQAKRKREKEAREKKKKEDEQRSRKKLRQSKLSSQNALLAFVEELHGYKPGDFQRLFGKAAMAWKYKRGPSAATLLNQGSLHLIGTKAVRQRQPQTHVQRRRRQRRYTTPAGPRSRSRYQKHAEDLLSPCLQRALEHPGVTLHLDRLRLHHCDE